MQERSERPERPGAARGGAASAATRMLGSAERVEARRLEDLARVAHHEAGHAVPGEQPAMPASGPATNAALASAWAHHASPATTVTATIPVWAGVPVVGSTRRSTAAGSRAAPAPRRARGHRARPQAEPAQRAGPERVLDVDQPALGPGRLPRPVRRPRCSRARPSRPAG